MRSRSIVLDANILIRAVLGKHVPAMVERYSNEVRFFAPQIAFEEAVRHLPTIAERRRWDAAPLLESVERLRHVVEPVELDIIGPFRDAALARIGTRDPMDWPVVATALALDCPIWTEDQDFFGTGVATWTTARVEIYLANI